MVQFLFLVQILVNSVFERSRDLSFDNDTCYQRNMKIGCKYISRYSTQREILMRFLAQPSFFNLGTTFFSSGKKDHFGPIYLAQIALQ